MSELTDRQKLDRIGELSMYLELKTEEDLSIVEEIRKLTGYAE